jgi:hypothetical protein
MIKTQITWLTGQAVREVSSKLNEMKAQGKTDGTRTFINETDTQSTWERTWIDADAANEWIDFIKTLDPVSAVIVE